MASDAAGNGDKPAPSKKLQDEANQRLADARAQKTFKLLDMQEAYFFGAPARSRQLSSGTKPPAVPPEDESVLQISIGIEESENFGTTLIQSFMPPGVEWISPKASASIPDIIEEEVRELGDQVKKQVFSSIRDSNFYATLPMAMNPDAAVGTFGLMIERKRLDKPVSVMAVPISELEINVGPDGRIDDRFAVRHTKARYLETLLGDIPIPKKAAKKKPTEDAVVVWGFWRLWSEETVTWQKVVLVDDELAYSGHLVGLGSCPLIPIPFGRYPECPWGIGPLLRAAPELRQLDEMAAGEVENIDVSLRPPMSYPDDSFTNVEHGVEPGGWYPIRPGTEGAIKKMYEPNSLEAVYFEQQKREQRVRRLFYNDFPQQRGDTPPTATQWVDEMAMAQRRIGTPGLAFWEDGPAEIFMRFFFLEKEAGRLPKLEAGGTALTFIPENPTKQAQDQQKVAMVVRGGQIGLQMFPEEFKAGYDGVATLDNVFDLLGVKDLVPKRSADQIGQAVSMISKMSGADPNTTTLQPGQLGGPAPTPPAGA